MRLDKMDYAEALLEELREKGSKEQAEKIAGYLKTSNLEFLGVKLPIIEKITKQHMKELTSEERIELMRSLWANRCFESRRAAVNVMKEFTKKEDFDIALNIIDEWIDDMDTWALMDPIGSNCLGTLLLRNQDLEMTLQEWSKDKNFWRRRASILPYLFLSLKQNHKPEYNERILAAVKPHLSDEEFFVGKAAGWVIRELSKRNPDIVRTFIEEHHDSMTKLVLRESSKKI